jgi:dTDP-D-glucose 4,6-dehydratase
VFGKGDNLIPTIHIIDIARCVRRMVAEDLEHKYVFCIDRTKKPTQKRIVQAISKGVGTG